MAAPFAQLINHSIQTAYSYNSKESLCEPYFEEWWSKWHGKLSSGICSTNTQLSFRKMYSL